MKLRALALLLVLANLGFFVWSRGWLDGLIAARATGEHEPERLARQVRPQSVRVLPEAAGVAAMKRPAATGTCLEAGPFAAADAEAALAQWREQGARDAHIVPPETPGGDVMLRVDAADPALAARLTQGGERLGKPVAACATQ